MRNLKRGSSVRLSPRQFTTAMLTVGMGMVVTACSGLTEANPTPNRYGSISIRATASSATTASAKATAVFFDAFTAAVPNSALQRTDRCEYAAVDTATVATRGTKRAGNEVTIAVGATNIVLPYEAGFLRYANLLGTPFTYAVGDNAQVSIPGEGDLYPSANISVPLVEPLLPGPVVLPTGTESMNVTWNPSTDTTTAIILSLRYANPSTSTYANEQIYCALKDDGAHQLASSTLAAFLASPSNRRSLTMTRWRTRETLIDARTLLHIATSVDTIIPFQP